MLNETTKFKLASSYAIVIINGKTYTIKENVEEIRSLIKTSYLKEISTEMHLGGCQKNRIKQIRQYLNGADANHKVIKYFETLVNAAKSTMVKKPREEVILAIARYSATGIADFEKNLVEQYIISRCERENMANRFIQCADEIASEENTKKTSKKKSDKKSKKSSEKSTEEVKSSKKTNAHANKYEIKNGILFCNGQSMCAVSLMEHIVNSMDNGISSRSYVNFLDKCRQNPRADIKDEIFLFLTSGKFPIANDGDFYAYKKVDENFRDSHTHKMDNTPGMVVEMPRDKVCEKRSETCAPGLHFAAWEYAMSYCGSRLVLLKINPKDVVSIPSDYNNQKGRCCKYKVVCEIEDKFEIKNIGDEAFLAKLEQIEAKNTSLLKKKVSKDKLVKLSK